MLTKRYRRRPRPTHPRPVRVQLPRGAIASAYNTSFPLQHPLAEPTRPIMTNRPNPNHTASHCQNTCPPERDPENMTSFDYLSVTGSAHHLIPDAPPRQPGHCHRLRRALHPARTELPACPAAALPTSLSPSIVARAAYVARNAYIISEPGKPPDFVLEIASPRTAHIDIGAKRRDYAALGILEYWCFDETGRHHGARLAGDRLVNGQCQPIAVVRLGPDIWQGYSPVLRLLRRERGQLQWRDPATGRHIATFGTSVLPGGLPKPGRGNWKRAAAEPLMPPTGQRLPLAAACRRIDAMPASKYITGAGDWRGLPLPIPPVF